MMKISLFPPRFSCRNLLARRNHSTNPDSQTFTLSTGRTLGFSITGPSTAPTIFFMHGNPSSRIEGRSFAHAAARVPARIITPDRPGIGLSSSQPGRSLLDFPPVLEELASHLQLSSYAVLGGSAGGAYALACAYALPRDRLTSVGVLAGMAPPSYASQKDLRLLNRMAQKCILWTPSFMGWMMYRFGARQAMDPNPLVYRHFIEGQLKWAPKAERNLLMKDEASFEEFLWISREHFRQGVEGHLDEGRILASEWGFQLEDVGGEGVKLWYGEEDVHTPVSMAREMAGRLKGSELKVYPSETHFSVSENHGEDILRALVKS